MEETNLSPIEEKLTQYLEVIEESVQAGAELASEELPLLAQEIVFAEQITAGVWTLVFTVATGMLIFLARRAWSLRDRFGDPVLSVILYFVSVLTFVSSAVFLTYFLRATFAPRLVIIDYIKDLL